MLYSGEYQIVSNEAASHPQVGSQQPSLGYSAMCMDVLGGMSLVTASGV